MRSDPPPPGVRLTSDRPRPGRPRADRLVAIAVLGVIAFNAPLLALFDRPILLGGIPLLYLYLFGVWALLVALTAVAMRRC